MPQNTATLRIVEGVFMKKRRAHVHYCLVDNATGTRPHIQSSKCWCGPTLFFEAENGNQVWVHKGPGDDLPPSDMLAAAVAAAITDTLGQDIEEQEE
jgi:hypothetical protein